MVRYGDDSGHSKNNPALGAYIGYLVAPKFGLTAEQGAVVGGYAGSGNTNIGRDIDHGAKAIAKNSQAWVNYQMAVNFGFVVVKGDPAENIKKTIQWALEGIDGVINPKKKKNDFQKSDVGKFLAHPMKFIIGSDFDHIYGAGLIGRNPGCSEFVANAGLLVASVLTFNEPAAASALGTMLINLGYTAEAVNNAVNFYKAYDLAKGIGSNGESSRRCTAKSL